MRKAGHQAALRSSLKYNPVLSSFFLSLFLSFFGPQKNSVSAPLPPVHPIEAHQSQAGHCLVSIQCYQALLQHFMVFNTVRCPEHLCILVPAFCRSSEAYHQDGHNLHKATVAQFSSSSSHPPALILQLSSSSSHPPALILQLSSSSSPPL